MISTYNKLYNNSNYAKLSDLVARDLKVSKEDQGYLDLMVKIQDKALWFCLEINELGNTQIYTHNEFMLLVYGEDDTYEAYSKFMEPFQDYFTQQLYS